MQKRIKNLENHIKNKLSKPLKRELDRRKKWEEKQEKIVDEAVLAVIMAGIKPVSFNLWRKYYGKLTFSQHSQIYSAWSLIYPDRQDQNYCLPAVLKAIDIVKNEVGKENLRIFELGGYRGGLAYDVLTYYEKFVYTNLDFCYIAIARSISHLNNYDYKAVHLVKPFWETNISTYKKNCDLFITSHMFEHLINKEVFKALDHVTGVPYIYIQMPIRTQGYHNVGAGHICSLSWQQIYDHLGELGYELIESDCLDRWTKRMCHRYTNYTEIIKLLRFKQ